ncbi:MAG TPA: sugar ABC transporter permease [Victivallales bacterium]|nr:sugar ABC transporter permease [Victivallales bacterium]
MSFQNFGLLGSKGYIGLENYRKLFADPFFYQTIWNTLIVTVGIVAASVLIPIIIAIALDNLLLQKVKKFVQTTIYVPFLFSALIIIGIYINLLSPVGPFNSIMGAIGLISEPIPFFTSDTLGRWMLIYMTAWHDIGFYTLIYLAALTTINPSLYEAADIDGANVFQKSRYVTFPGILSTVKIVLLMVLMGAMRTFDMSYVMKNAANYKGVTTAIVYTYDQGILKFDMGLASAAAGIIFILSLLLVFTVKKIIRY